MRCLQPRRQSSRQWDTTSGEKIAILVGHTNDVNGVAYSPDGKYIASRSADKTIRLWSTASNEEVETDATVLSSAKQWLGTQMQYLTADGQTIDKFYDPINYIVDGHLIHDGRLYIVQANDAPDLAIRLREGLLSLPDRELVFRNVSGPTKMLPVRNDLYAQLADPNLTPVNRAELQMQMCTKSSQFRAATAQWQRLLHGEWPGFEGATVPKDQAPATIPADSPIRRLYLLALIDATKHPQIHGHPTICQTALQIAPVLTKEMMATPTISLAMMSLMQTLAKDDSPDMSAPHAALFKRVEEVATQDWLAVLRESVGK